MNVQTVIDYYRHELSVALSEPLQWLAAQCANLLDNTAALDAFLFKTLNTKQQVNLPNKKFDITLSHLIYIITPDGRQISSNISHQTIDCNLIGQDLSQRPYIANMHFDDNCVLSPVYIDKISHNPYLTASHPIRNLSGEINAYLMVDFDLVHLPSQVAPQTQTLYSWQQIKGDPAIRCQLFNQERIVSAVDNNLQQVNDILTDLMCHRGIFHAKLHYSSSRATLWLYSDPYHYRLHVLDEIISPEICLAYPQQAYPKTAEISPAQIPIIFDRFSRLRHTDRNIYLRSASLNIINAMVGLTFSCDGSHYMPVNKFLENEINFN